MITFKRQFPWIGHRKVMPKEGMVRLSDPLREFVYLDEVSLGSLLASQKGEVTENITSQMGDQWVAEVGAKISAKAPVLPSAEINSRFQTTNSSGLQTLRKSTAQSLFRELHNIPKIRKIQPIKVSESAVSFEHLFSGEFIDAIHSEADLIRGDLVEFKVKLSASWIFQISSMVAEFSEIFDESPMLFFENVSFYELYQAKNANKVITKLLAGLVPVDGIVTDYVVIRHEDNKFIVHKDAARSLNTSFENLRIVGVTEHLAYWKDIRQILFADNEFTMLCRLSKNGIQKDWNPIKVADIFKEIAPDIAKQIEVSSRAAMLRSNNDQSQEIVDPIVARFGLALARYQDRLLERLNHRLSEKDLVALDKKVANLLIEPNSAEGERSAFAAVKSLVEEFSDLKIDSLEDLEIRESVRHDFSLPVFPQASQKNSHVAEDGGTLIEVGEANLLDVEVVAIYW